MKKEQAQQLGRQAAEMDIADKILDEGGYIIDKPMLHDHLIEQIIGKLEGTAFKIKHLREILDFVGGYRNDFIDHGHVDARLKARFPEQFSSPLRAIDEGDAIDPLREAHRAYQSLLVESRTRAGIEHGDWKNDPETEEWSGEEAGPDDID